MLKEFVEEYQKAFEKTHFDFDALEVAVKKCFPYSTHGFISGLKPEDYLVLLKEYNELVNPSISTTEIVTEIGIGKYSRKRLFSPKDANIIIEAYEKCASNLSKENGKGDEKSRLCINIEAFVRNHPETGYKAFDIYDKYLFDVRHAMDGVSFCIQVHPDLLDKSFGFMHKMADSLCKQAEIDAKMQNRNPWVSKPHFAASESLRMAFACLYNRFETPKSSKYFDVITEKLMDFENQIEPSYLGCVVGFCDENSDRSAVYRIKREIVVESLKEASLGEKKFSEIYYDKMKEKTEVLKTLVLRDAQKGQLFRIFKAKKAMKMSEISKLDFVYMGDERPDIVNFGDIHNYLFSMVWIKQDGNPSKPLGGLWASPIMENERTDWDNWLETDGGQWMQNKVGQKRWYLLPKKDCRILQVSKDDDVRKYMLNREGHVCTDEDLKIMKGDFFDCPSEYGRKRFVIPLDYEAMSRDYDAIYLPTREDSWSPVFYGWDVKSLLIFNLRKFDVQSEEEHKLYEQQEQKTVMSEGDYLNLKKPDRQIYNHQLMLKHSKEIKGK